MIFTQDVSGPLTVFAALPLRHDALKITFTRCCKQFVPASLNAVAQQHTQAVKACFANVEPFPPARETSAESSYFPALVAPLPSRTPTVIATESVAKCRL